MINKPLQAALEGIGKRHISLIPTWLLGTGAQFGGLTPYSRMIAFTLLVTVFFQELFDDPKRTREDLIATTMEICRSMFLSCSYEEAEKIVDSMLWSESKHFQFAFEDVYFDEKKRSWEKFRFQYFVLEKMDDYDVSQQIYKLSEKAQEIVLKSHEIIEEMDISIQQLVAEMLIKRGNLTRALRMLDALDFRVRNLINEEKEHKEDLIRNPKRAILQKQNRWGTQLDKIKQQFNDELARYSQMQRILNRLEILEEQRGVYLQLTRRIMKTSSYHDELAKLVIENIRLEMQIMNSQFSAMWMANGTSFRKTVWEESILPLGFAHPDDMFDLVESILSPNKPFLMPLEWGIEEQTVLSREIKFVSGNAEKEKESLEPVGLDWDTIVSLWKPVFLELMDKGEVSIDWIKKLDEFTLARWVENKEAFDFWIALGSLERPLHITDELLGDTTDTVIELLNELMVREEKFKALIGKVIAPKLMDIDEEIRTKKVEVSRYVITLKEENEK
ncbi:hypothetical protein [Peribacillus tepidiphilus]|jgi:hypothetical protein|uniref:hypothetical protein n=1 Tax=Peribacillus tepidiphilus TaxID=2652445 RepID=UPI001290D7C3|nr:hypothetical protein [Peribacillus tepidiphilus]